MNSNPLSTRHYLLSGSIVVAVTALLAILCADVVRDFFPYAEEWKIMLPSLPGLANPGEWFLSFAGVMADPYPAWAVEAINFWRPMMHIVYWLRGALFGEDWGAYLYFNFAAIGLAAGALFLALRIQKHSPDTRQPAPAANLWLALALVGAFLLMPPMVSATARFLPLLVPQFPFGRLLAALCLMAALAYLYRRYWLATLWVAIALTTKEQALPMAIALPLTYAWTSRREIRASLPTLALLAAPLLAWIALRLLLFGSISQGVYVLEDGSASVLRSLTVGLLKLPLFAPSLSGALRDPFSIAALLVACNCVVLAYLAVDVIKRWWDSGPDLISVAFVGYWGFLAIVGLNPRYGTLIIALAILMCARRPAAGVPGIARSVALAALVVTGLVHGAFSLRSYNTHVAFSQTIYQVGRDYRDALAGVAPGSKAIIVLNDPNTVYTAPSEMAEVLGLPVAAVHKASDYPWQWPEPYADAVPEHPCEVSVTALNATTVELLQSCGLQIAGALVPNDKPPVLPIIPGVEAVFPQARFSDAGLVTDLGQRLVLHINTSDIAVLYFDPQTRSFKWIERTAESASIHKEVKNHD